MITLRRRRPLTCQEVVELVSDYLEGALGRSTRRRLEAHLRGCDPCVGYFDQIRTTVAITQRIRAEHVAPTTTAHLVDLYRQWQQP
jgi:predicted anti-sigma-YlaC factor YlaD